MTTIAWSWKWPLMSSELLVSQSVADMLVRHRQKGRAVEKGGQLFVNPNYSSGLLLARATPPHPADRAGRAWLELDTKRCRKEVETANAEGLRLVGYWHTHPQAIPQLSPADVNSFTRLAARNNQELPHPIAIIVGNSKFPESIKAWSFRERQCIEANRY